MKIGFIEAFSGEGENYVFYPLGLACIEAYLNEKLPEIDTKICRSQEVLFNFEPDIVGISSTSPYYSKAVEIAKRAKKDLGAKVFLGGPHISSLPESLDPIFDAGVTGEGEYTFFKIVKNILENKDFTDTKGLVLKDDSGITHFTGKSEMITDIDSLPFSKRKWSDTPYLHNILSSRGCPFKCKFCASAYIWQTVRFYSPQRVADELKYLSDEFDVKLVTFLDDLFAVNLHRVDLLAEVVSFAKERQISFVSTLRADNCSKELTQTLFDMGVRYAHFGAESASDKILSFLKGGQSSSKKNEEALINSHESGLHNTCSFIIGSPEEDEDDINLTYNFLKNGLKDGIINEFLVAPLMAFPGTYFWDYACEQGLIIPEKMDWKKLLISSNIFEPNNYIFLSEKISLDRFLYHFNRFKELHDDFLSKKI